jgi:nitroreductase
METWDAITARRDVRMFSDEPVSPEHLDRILEAGRRAPSSQNTQPWDFVVVTQRAQLRELSTTFVGAKHVASSAATIALVVGNEGEQRRLQFDLGQATMSMMIAAADLGIGSGHGGVADEALANRVLGLPPDRVCAFLISLGYPEGRPLAPIRNPDRKPFDEVVHRGTW